MAAISQVTLNRPSFVMYIFPLHHDKWSTSRVTQSRIRAVVPRVTAQVRANLDSSISTRTRKSRRA